MTTPDERADARDALRDVVRRLLEDKSSPARVRTVIEEPTGYDRRLWLMMAELGWTGLEIPETDGGAGYGFAETAVVLEALGRQVTPGPFLATVVLGAGVLMAVADPPARQELLPRIAAGDLTTALIAPLVGGAPTWSLRPSGRGLVLSGQAPLVLDGGSADLLLVVVTDQAHAGGASLLAVPAATTGVGRRSQPTIDVTRRLCDVTFDEVVLSEHTLIGRTDDAGSLATWLLDRAVTALALDCVGGAERVLEMSVAYAKVRTQFGRPIGTFQTIKHRCADMLLMVEASRAAAEDAASMIGPSPSGANTAAAIAMSYAADAYAKVAGDGIQLHGGIGFTWDHDLHLYFKRAKLNQVLFGTPSWHRARLADIVMPRGRGDSAPGQVARISGV